LCNIAWQSATWIPWGAVDDDAVGVAWWLGAAFFALASTLPHQQWFRVLAIWSVPIAYLLTLTKTPLEPAWRGVALAVLAGMYFLFGYWRRAEVDCTLWSLAREPIYQMAVLLTLLAALWPAATLVSLTVTLLTIAVVYAAATQLLGQRVFAYVAVYLLPIAYGFLLAELEIGVEFQALAWSGLAFLLLGLAEAEVRRTHEDRRPLIDLIGGLGTWRSRFASPLFSAGYLVSLLAFAFAWQRVTNTEPVSGLRQVDPSTALACLVLAVLAGVSSLTRRTSFFLFMATWLILIPLYAITNWTYAQCGLPVTGAELARVLAVLGVGYVLLGRATDRIGGHYAKAFYLVGYCLSVGTMLISASDRLINTQVVVLSIAVYAVSAWWVYRGQHPSFMWSVAVVVDANSLAARHVACVFMYLACWLFPVWILLAMSLRWPSPDAADYGFVLAVLAPAYVAGGLRAHAIRPEYRWPWYLAGYALSVVGPLIAVSAPIPRLVALTISVVLYAVSCLVFRRSIWMYPVALLTPVILWQTLERLRIEPGFYGLALVALAIMYVVSGVLLQHRTLNASHLLEPVRAPIDAYARPYFALAYALCVVGLALASSQERGVVVLTFTLASALFGMSAFVSRLSLFAYPMLGSLIVAYVVGMTLTNLHWQAYGLGLLPGMLVCLAAADVARHRVDLRPGRENVTLVKRWATPFYATTYLGTLAVPVWSTADQRAWITAWWAVALVYALSAALIRRPIWLYLSLAAVLVAFVATLRTLLPDVATTVALASLVVPSLVLFGIAGITARRLSRKPTLEVLTGSWLNPNWCDPFAAVGWAALAVAVGGSVLDPTAGLVAAGAAATLLAVTATLWRGRAEVWICLAMGSLTYWQAMRVQNVPAAAEPQYWAMAGLAVGLLAIGLRRLSWRAADLWPKPMLVVSVAAGGMSILAALGLLLSLGRPAGLQTLSTTVAITGLTVVAHGFDRHDRILGYQGVALLLVGFMLQLVVFDVGQVQAFALPAGLYLLAIAYLEWRRGTDHRIKAVLEVAAVSLLLGVSLMQSVGLLCAGVDRYAYATFFLLEGVAVFGSGAVVHWRRSFLAGALAIVLDVVILLADPLRALNTWYLVAVIGLAMIAAVILIERQRQRIPFWVHEWRLRLESWD
jgi:hypothetical protein